MGALPVIADVFRCALNWTTSGGQTATNVIHIHDQAGGHNQSDAMAVLNATVTATMWRPVVPSAVVTDVAITPLDGSSATQHFAPATPAHWTGQNGTDFVPQVSVLLKLATVQRGRSKRGRVFLPFTAESSIQNGLVDSTQAASMTTDWTTFLSALLTHSPSWEWVVASYKNASMQAVDTVTCELVAATQRRRQGRLRGA
jgi:hypothetical protein